MNYFKIVASKDQKRFDLIIQADLEIEARDKIHKDWYTILSIEKVDNLNLLWNKFFFTVKKEWDIKNWVIYWDDIFKVYLKLRKDFDYEVISLFNEKDKDKTNEEKNEILKKIEEEYYFFTWIKNQKNIQKRNLQEKEENKNILEKDFFLKKELEEINKSTDNILIKIQSFLNNSLFKLSLEDREKINILYNSIISIKNWRNINKLREINELALVKIWNIELEYLEKTKNEKIWKLLKETNLLLKQLWSKEQIIEKEKDVLYQAKKFFSLFNFWKNKKKTVNEWKLDKESHSYIKTLVLIKKYKEKRQIVNKKIIKSFFSLKFNWEELENLRLKKSVINQNISILNAKLKWKIYSYTKITRWYKKIEEKFINLLKSISNQLNVILVFFSIVFFIFISLGFFGFIDLDINLYWISIIIYLIISMIFLCISKGFISFTLYFVFLVFLNIFFIVNF